MYDLLSFWGKIPDNQNGYFVAYAVINRFLSSMMMKKHPVHQKQMPFSFPGKTLELWWFVQWNSGNLGWVLRKTPSTHLVPLMRMVNLVVNCICIPIELCLFGIIFPQIKHTCTSLVSSQLTLLYLESSFHVRFESCMHRLDCWQKHECINGIWGSVLGWCTWFCCIPDDKFKARVIGSSQIVQGEFDTIDGTMDAANTRFINLGANCIFFRGVSVMRSLLTYSRLYRLT